MVLRPRISWEELQALVVWGGLVSTWVQGALLVVVVAEGSFLMGLLSAIPSWVGRGLMCPRDLLYSLIVIAAGDPDSKHRL